MISAAASLLATALMARALGPAEFGLVVLLHTYVIAVRALTHMRPAETLVRFAVPLLDAGDRGGMNRLLGLIRSVERLTSILATAVAVLAAPLAALAFGWDDDVVPVAMLYALVLLGTAVGHMRGYLRATERFDLLRTQMAIGPSLRLAGIATAWWFEASWQWFALSWAVAYVAGQRYLAWRGSRQWRAAGFAPEHLSWRTADAEFSGWRRFMGVVYGQGVLDQMPRHLITLLIGALLGAAAAGLFRVARELADVLAKPVQLIRQAAFTELTRRGQQGRDALRGVFRQYGLRLLLPAAALVTAAGLFRVELLTLIGGEEFAAAGALLLLLLIAAAIDLVGAVLRPLAYAMNRAGGALRVQMWVTALYLAVFVLLHGALGVAAAGIAALVAACATLAGLGYLVSARR